MQRLLEAWGHAVFTAGSFEEALEYAHERPSIDLLLSDYRLSRGLTGIQAIDAVRAALGREVEAAIVTGDTSPATLRKIQARKLRLLHKPLDEEQLRELMGGPALLAGQLRASENDSNAAVAVGRGGPANFRLLIHTGHRNVEAPVQSPSGLG